MVEIKHIPDSNHLPSAWDELADHYFQQTKFLLHTEKYNPCHQRYYICLENEKLVSAAIVYSLQLDIFTFVNIKSPIKMHIVGIPCSVSNPGIFGSKVGMEALKKHIAKVEKGFVLFLNLKEKPDGAFFASGKTLPTMVLKNQFLKWDNYVALLRSNYRRRLHIITKATKDLRFQKITCAGFTDEMYKQYLEVYKKSSGKLEKLGFNFFKNLPPEFILTVCFNHDSIMGWNIALQNQNKYYFFLGGVNYKLNKIHSTYLGLLSTLIKDGIEKRAEFIELGQTAEIPKMRMGGKPEPLYMEAHHSSKILHSLIKICSPLLEYRQKLENTNAIKEGIA